MPRSEVFLIFYLSAPIEERQEVIALLALCCQVKDKSWVASLTAWK